MLSSFHEEVLVAYESRILTPELDLSGQIHLAAPKPGLNPQSTSDWLNYHASPLVPLAGARLYRSGSIHTPEQKDMLAVLTAIAVRKQDVFFVTGGRPSNYPATFIRRRRAVLLYPKFALIGYLVCPDGQSFGQYVAQSKPFQTMFEAELYLLETDKPLSQLECAERYEFLTVNLSQVRSFFSPPEPSGNTQLTFP